MKYSQYLKFGISFLALFSCVASITWLQKDSLNKLETVQHIDIYEKEQKAFTAAAKIQKANT